MDIEKILAGVPDYETFLTVDELDESSRSLAAQYPEAAELFEAGKSRKGQPILCLKIGNGAKNALCFACPHPNEPIGAMTLEFFSRLLAEDAIFREETNFTWYLIKCVDPDGVRLNEKWFKGPFNIYNYSKNYFRPVGFEQVEWTFPIDYKEIHFHSPMPETKAVMKIIDETRPHFVYSLHNAGFGGAYWYLTHGIPELYEPLRGAAARQDVVLNLGEPEAPYVEQFDPAVYRMLGSAQSYDYTEKYTGKPPKEPSNHGTSSGDYATLRRPECVTLLTELPYFYDKRIQDMSEGNMTRREAVLQNIADSRNQGEVIRKIFEPIRARLSENNPFPKLSLTMLDHMDETLLAKENWARSNAEFERKATVSEIFDNLLVAKFYSLLSLGSAVRACQFELENAGGDAEALERSMDMAIEAHKNLCDELESKLDYKVIPIKKLVSIQVESGLLVTNHLKSTEP
jgi:hypothetical protein